MLEVVQLTKTFTNGKAAFHELNFKIENSTIVGVLGTSGCGKSTLLRVLSGLESASRGKILLDNVLLKGIDSRVNLVFQEPRLLPWLTVEQNIDFGLPEDIPRIKRKEIVHQVLELVGLTPHRALYPKHCSGGMAQRAALARALVRTPHVLLLDEPFSALDAFIRMQLQEVLLEIHQKSAATMILVTHDIDEALYLCDRILVLRGQPGRLVKDIKIVESRPRHRGSPSLARLKENILELLDLTVHHDFDDNHLIGGSGI